MLCHRNLIKIKQKSIQRTRTSQSLNLPTFSQINMKNTVWFHGVLSFISIGEISTQPWLESKMLPSHSCSNTQKNFFSEKFTFTRCFFDRVSVISRDELTKWKYQSTESCISFYTSVFCPRFSSDGWSSKVFLKCI